MSAIVATPMADRPDIGASAPYDGITSVEGLLSQLEDEPYLQEFALTQLWELGLVDRFWIEVVGKVGDIEALSEDPEFSARQIAAAVASKCYYHLEDYPSALRLALSAGSHFNVDNKSEYVERMISECIDRYIAKRVAAAEEGDEEGSAADADMEAEDIDIGDMEVIVNKMFDRCFNDGAYTQAAGVALEARRLDKVEESIVRSEDTSTMLSFVLETALEQVASKEFRADVLRIVVRLYNEHEAGGGETDFLALCRCLQFLGDAKAIATVLEKLVRASEGDRTGPAGGDEEALLMAYQVGFDLSESDNQQFMLEVNGHLPKKPSPPDDPKDGDEEPKAPPAEAAADGETPSFWEKMDRLRSIVDGSMTADIFLDFLYHNQKIDMVLLKKMKTAVTNRSSLLHNAVVVAHAYMACGTTVDRFLLVHIDWLKKAANWARFTATAGQGVVHKGHVKEAMRVLEPYLRKEGQPTTSAFTEGGSLYALGLIHANRGGSNSEVLSYLRTALGDTNDETVQHGGCLGLGLAAMATADDDSFGQLRTIMMQESAVAGEGAGLGIGMLLAGAGPSWRSATADEIAAQEMLSYAHSTRHDKVTRGVSMGLALMMYGQEEHATPLIEQMVRDSNYIIRYGAMFAVGMAFCGTANNGAVRRLLHIAVSDVSDDVRRAAVINLGFVMVNKPHKVPVVVSLLAKSYNPHVRYGAAMAVGIACAGSGSAEALRLLEPLCDDVESYVRQGALLGMAMVLQQVAEARNVAAKKLREKCLGIIEGKHHAMMEKMGAIMAVGILDAGGRNSVISLRSRAGFVKMPAVIGVALWLQYWYWYPLMHMLSLSMNATAVIGVNKDMKIPKGFQVTCEAPPSWFAYPEMMSELVEEKKERVKTVELSTTAKAKAKARAKKRAEEEAEKASGGDGADADMSGEGGESKGEGEEKGDGDAAAESDKKGEGAEKAAEAKKVANPGPFVIDSPARVTHLQQQYVTFEPLGRWVPVRQDAANSLGVVVLRDTKPDEEAELIDILSPPANLDDEAAEPGPPEPFEWKPTPY